MWGNVLESLPPALSGFQWPFIRNYAMFRSIAPVTAALLIAGCSACASLSGKAPAPAQDELCATYFPKLDGFYGAPEGHGESPIGPVAMFNKDGKQLMVLITVLDPTLLASFLEGTGPAFTKVGQCWTGQGGAILYIYQSPVVEVGDARNGGSDEAIAS